MSDVAARGGAARFDQVHLLATSRGNSMTRVSHISARTTTALLDGLLDAGNREAWEEFDRRYRPLVIAFCVKLGLSDTDAADVAQEAVTRFVVLYRQGKYDRQRGRLRSWLIALTKNRIDDVRRRYARQRISRGESAIVALPSNTRLTTIWEEQRRRVILEQALHDVRSKSRCAAHTLEAFELLCLRQLSPAVVAERLDMSIADVFRAKSRVASHLRRAIARRERLDEVNL